LTTISGRILSRCTMASVPVTALMSSILDAAIEGRAAHEMRGAAAKAAGAELRNVWSWIQARAPRRPPRPRLAQPCGLRSARPARSQAHRP
jgi:hypothetical protein